MPATSSASRGSAPPVNVKELLVWLMESRLVDHKTVAYATVELGLDAPISHGVTAMLTSALEERAKHAPPHGLSADNALLIINTVRGDSLPKKPY